MKSVALALVLIVAATVSGCATSRPSGGPAAFQPVCQPCPMPCTPDSCNPPKVAEAPKPPPPPPPPPPPAPKQPAAAPTFSPAPGTFDSPQQVTLSTATPGATIHYTTDGSAPTESSPVYSGPITVDKNTSIKAIAVGAGLPASDVASGGYAITPSRVTVTKEKLELKDKIYFETNKADIKPQSYSLLDEVATALKNHPEVAKLTIEGHTDSTGTAKLNRALSQKRAEAVRAYLVQKGIDASRLDAKGFGPDKPVASNKTAKGREANRRVEFRIAQ